MKLNIFCIPQPDVEPLEEKLTSTGLAVIKEVSQSGWAGKFYYSARPHSTPVSWAEPFQSFFEDGRLPQNVNYFAAFVFIKGERCYVLSYGKAHFYLRKFCDYDFGIEVAKRIANERDTRQTSSRRYRGRRKKDIKSFTLNTSLDVEGGESLDYIQAGIIEEQKTAFGKMGRFGSSVLLTPDIDVAAIGSFLTELDTALSLPARFKLPRTEVLTAPDEIAHYDEKLIDELLNDVGESELAQNSYDLWGVDFVFASDDGTFTLTCPGKSRQELDHLTMRELKEYIAANNINRQDALKVKIHHEPEASPSLTHAVKDVVDFIVDGDRVVLSNGRWMHFNQDYMEFLDGYLQGIPVEEVEPQFRDIALQEPVFNRSEEIRAAGYELADQNFGIFSVAGAAPIEAWDLRRGQRVYAVKFATAQKLGYVCDQAMVLLEAIRNAAGREPVPEFDSYCLWLGYRGQRELGSITNTRSLILKQKIEAWARACRDQNVQPVLKISRKLKPGVDIET